MRKSVWILALGFILACQGVGNAASTVDSLVQKLVEKGILTDKEATQLKGEIASNEANTIEAGTKKQLPDWVTGIKFSGDFRLRDQIERRSNRTAANDLVRNRVRFRARLNVEDQLNDKLKFVFGVATNGENGVSPGNARSNNITFGGNAGSEGSFNKPNAVINKAYAVYTPNIYTTLMGGKMDNPIWEPASLLWDADITPEGGAIQLQKRINDYITPFSTNAIFIFKDNAPSTALTSSKTDPYIFVSQEGIKGNLTEKVYYKAAGSYYNVNNPNHLALDNRPSAAGFAGNNTNTPSSTTGLTGTYSYNYNLIGGGVELGMNDPFGELLPSPIYIPQIGAFGQYFRNMDPSHENSAWMMGAYMGNSSINGFGTWRIQSYYKVLERDAWLDALPDDDFYSGATDTSGWRSQIDIGLAKNTWFTLSYFRTGIYKTISNLTNFSAKAPESLFQADLNFKF